MKKKIELLAPGGDVDSIKAAIAAGADAVYCGLNKFNARNRATNINFEDLNGILTLAHKNNCQIFLTLNIIIVGSEIPAIIRLLNKLVNTKIDGLIVQDLGLFYLLSRYFPGLKIHASTQLTTHNEGQIKFLKKLTATRVNLSRELNIDEIKSLTMTAHKNNLATEIFIHGSQCIAFSGICYISSVLAGNSGNRGRCSQPCRDRYLMTPQGNNFPLNLKDNSAYFDLKKISDAAVDSIKIEGRIKKLDYVYTVVGCWKKHMDKFYHHNRLDTDDGDLYKVFNRDFSNAYLKGDINKNMFIDNPRDHSIKQFSKINDNLANKKLLHEKKQYYDDKARINADVKNKIKHLSIARLPLTIRISGRLNAPLNVSVTTKDTSFTVHSKINLVLKNKESNTKCLTHPFFVKSLSALNNTEYYIKQLESQHLKGDLFLPFKEVSLIKKRILYILNGSKKFIAPISTPFLKKESAIIKKPALGVLISSKKDLNLGNGTMADIFFQLPNSFKNEYSALTTLFLKNKKLIPWFPSILIGENYTTAVKFLHQVQPKRIVTNNTGIAYEANNKEIPWIAGPYLNIVNSFSLLSLKENFNCYGSFISNELNKYQIKSIIKPKNFNLYYSIYHPILLLTTRLCLHHQVTGCEKNTMNEECLDRCNKSSSITNLKKQTLFITKSKGNYHRIYNNNNFLNTQIVMDFPDVFSGFFIDLRDIKTETQIETDKFGMIQLFENLLNGTPDSKEKLKHMVHCSINTQYKKGI